MGLAELIESGKMSDALILTVGLIEKSEHENVDVDALLAAYRLCHTKDTDIYLCTMIQSGILRILHNVTHRDIPIMNYIFEIILLAIIAIILIIVIWHLSGLTQSGQKRAGIRGEKFISKLIRETLCNDDTLLCNVSISFND